MRFDRRLRFEPLTWTARKEVAYLGRHKRAQAKIDREYPLFAHQFVPEPLNDVEVEKERRERMALAGEQRMRDLEAKHWREGRAAYFACEPAVRQQIIAEWTGWRGPARAGSSFISSKSPPGLLTKERDSIAPESRSCGHRSRSGSMQSVP
ncbi:hypothetical protein [Paraburkholderia dipogonis]|uniref:hypothetical protein n=1 Tax=Paraburkholderia dipogonis TaxID=1211383 RepID=UPI0038B97237